MSLYGPFGQPRPFATVSKNRNESTDSNMNRQEDGPPQLAPVRSALEYIQSLGLPDIQTGAVAHGSTTAGSPSSLMLKPLGYKIFNDALQHQQIGSQHATVDPKPVVSSPYVSPPASPNDSLAMVFSQRNPTNCVVFQASRAASEKLLNEMCPGSNLHRLFTPMPALGESFGYNPNYQGMMTHASNQGYGIPQSENCALWVTLIPAQAGLGHLLGTITGIGRVYSSHLNAATGGHTTNAVKLVFFTPEAAQHLMYIAATTGIWLFGQRLSIIHNRNKYRRHTKHYESRVLRIRGPSTYVNYGFLDAYITSLMVADVLMVHDIDIGMAAAAVGICEQEWHFGSVCAQAAALKLAIEMEPGLRGLQVSFVADPCE